LDDLRGREKKEVRVKWKNDKEKTIINHAKESCSANKTKRITRD
jgi:hypothetical protein